MQSTQADTEKRIVEQLNFGSKTAKRAIWEAWTLKIVGPREVRVTNVSYGCEKNEHRYTVTVEESDGVIVPVECECPADQYNEEYSCKHRVAVATIGGPVVLNAAMAFDPDEPEPADEIVTDGGSSETETCPNEDSLCDGPAGDGLPCFDCYEQPGKGA